MKNWINVACGVFLLSSAWKGCLSNLLQEKESDLTNLQEFNAVERIEDTPYGLHGYDENKEDVNESNAEDGHSDIAFLKDSSYRRKRNRHCICYRRSSRRRGGGGGGWRPLPRPYK